MQSLYLKRGRTLELQGNFKAALANYDELMGLAAGRQDRTLELAALIASATVYSIPSTSYDRERSVELTTTALELARNLNDKPAQATILWNMMLADSRVGVGFVEALKHGEEALKIAQENNLVERTAYVLNDIAPLLVFRGQLERGHPVQFGIARHVGGMGQHAHAQWQLRLLGDDSSRQGRF